VRLPQARVIAKDEVFTVVKSGDANIALRLHHYPIPLTFAIFDEYALVVATPSPPLPQPALLPLGLAPRWTSTCTLTGDVCVCVWSLQDLRSGRPDG
jgi:hypothetical protein